MTEEQFMSFYKGNAAALQCYKLIKIALYNAGILSDLVLIGALATVRVEVGREFLPVSEKITRTKANLAYKSRMGNNNMDDGYTYRGRGFIQLTGKNNYRNYGRNIKLDLVAYPDKACEPQVAADILANYFKVNGIDALCNTHDWVGVRRAINGNVPCPNGLEEFIKVTSQYLWKK